MPMIDVYCPVGTFDDTHGLAQELSTILMAVEGVPDIPMFRENTSAFVHELEATAIANVDGESASVRVQVLTNSGALDRDKQLQAVAELSAAITRAASDPSQVARVWVLLTEAVAGGWGLWGHAHTNEELVAAARAEISRFNRT